MIINNKTKKKIKRLPPEAPPETKKSTKSEPSSSQGSNILLLLKADIKKKLTNIPRCLKIKKPKLL